MRVMSIDPGPHTGIFFVRDDFQYWHKTLDLDSESEQLTQSQHVILWEWLNNYSDLVSLVVLEKFEYQKEKAKTREHLNFDAAEYVGVVKLWCDLYGIDLVLMSPSQKGSGEAHFWNDDKLKRVGLWKGLDRHARDAARHYLNWLTFTKKDNTWVMKLK